MITEKELLDKGFIKVDDPLVWFRKELLSWDTVEDQDLEFDEIPCLSYGTNGDIQGFHLYTGHCIVWLNCSTVDEALEFSKYIQSFEPLY